MNSSLVKTVWKLNVINFNLIFEAYFLLQITNLA